MTRGVSIVRLALGGVGVLLLIGGVAIGVTTGIPGNGFFAIEMILGGVIFMVVAVVEISRYRSSSAELGHETPGPGGGEPGPLDGRFRRTDEVFVDPTSKRTMRVFVDANTGERRYVAEG